MPNKHFVSSNLISISSHFQVYQLLTPTRGVKNYEMFVETFLGNIGKHYCANSIFNILSMTHRHLITHIYSII